MLQNMPSNETLWFHYQFILPGPKIKEFTVHLHPETLDLLSEKPKLPPDWTRLRYHQCPHCPLNERQNAHCPVALNLAGVIDYFKDSLSYEEVDVEITTPVRAYRKHLALQHALSSLIGIYMVTSGCPVLDKLRPLANTHLPFATLEETTYRVISMYLLAQFFKSKKGFKPDWELADLARIYTDIETVNMSFHKRIAGIHTEDAGLNALFHLDCYAQFTNKLLLEEGMDQIEKFFSAYLKPQPDQIP